MSRKLIEVQVSKNGTVSLGNAKSVPNLVPADRKKKPKKSTGKSHVAKIGGQRFSIANMGPGGGYTSGSVNSTELILEKTERFIEVKAATAAAGPPVVAAGDFLAIHTPWHPGSGSLPWLRNMSNAFTSYEILALEFTYVPAVPTNVAGAVALGFYEDLVDLVPTDMPQMLVNEQAIYAPVYAGTDGGTYLQRFGNPGGNVISFNIPKRCIADERGTPRRFKIATDAVLATLSDGTNSEKVSAQTYTPGRFVVASQGAPSAQICGQVFVRYRVKLTGAISISNQR